MTPIALFEVEALPELPMIASTNPKFAETLPWV